MRVLRSIIALVVLFCCGMIAAGVEENAPHSPENQVFQFMQTGTCNAWSDGSTTTSAAYLWIPEACVRLRGLLVLCANVPEHRLVGHPAIRAVCAANDLGIVWNVPTFMNFRKDADKGTNMALEHATAVAFLQQQLDGLARTSGYDEVATVPWLPMGESGHLLMVDALVDSMPQRCIAGVWIKNHHFPPKNRDVPALVIFGTAQEWAQDKTDIRKKWSDVGGQYALVLNERKKHPQWPLSYVLDGSSGHFDCSETLTAFIARYIDQAAKVRLPKEQGAALNPVKMENGFLAGMKAPGHVKQVVTAFSKADPGMRAMPWFFDQQSAEQAQMFSEINWQAETQLPAFADAKGNVLPFDFNGISQITPEMEADGITFTLRGVMLDAVPSNFVGAGGKLAKAPGAPAMEWLCGPVAALGGDRFRVTLDRAWPSGACYVAARQAGTATLRASVQPCAVKLKKHAEGVKQTISFDLAPEVAPGAKSLALSATASSGMPVRFFVRSGPAQVCGNELVFTAVPPRSRRPVPVTVAAWQWGRSVEPKVQTASPVERTLYLP